MTTELKTKVAALKALYEQTKLPWIVDGGIVIRDGSGRETVSPRLSIHDNSRAATLADLVAKTISLWPALIADWEARGRELKAANLELGEWRTSESAENLARHMPRTHI